MKRRRSVQRWAAIAVVSVLPIFTGCSDFFPPINGGGSGGGSTSNRVYVANQAANSIGGFAIGTGTLAAVNNSPLATSYKPLSMVVTPNNALLYVGSATGGIFVYFINSDGSLTTPSTGSQPAGVFAARHGCFAGRTVADCARWHDAAARHLSDQCIDGCADFGECSNDLLHELRNMAAQRRARLSGWHADLCCARHSRRCRLHLQYQRPGLRPAARVSALETHKLVTTGLRSVRPAISYIARSGTNGGVAVYSIGSGASLTPVTGSPFAAGSGTFSVALDSTGTYVYAANRTDNTISGYTIVPSTTVLGLSLTAAERVALYKRQRPCSPSASILRTSICWQLRSAARRI